MSNFLFVNKTGKRHIRDHKPCEDSLFLDENNNVAIVCDGVSRALYGGEGSRSISNALGQYLKTPQVKKLLEHASVDEIRKIICNQIEVITRTLCASHSNASKSDFACTLIACVKTSERNITLIHAGDGALFAKPLSSSNSVCILSSPDNSLNGAVYDATHAQQESRMRVIRINPRDFEAIAICTDGFSEFYFNPSEQVCEIDSLSEVFNLNDNSDLEALVNEKHFNNTPDDISCIIYKIHETSQEATNDKNSFSFETEDFIFANTIQKSAPLKPTRYSPPPKPIGPPPPKNHVEIPTQKSAPKSTNTPIGASLGFCTAIITLLILGVAVITLNSKIDTLSESNKNLENNLNSLSAKYEQLYDSVNQTSVFYYENETNTEEQTQADYSNYLYADELEESMDKSTFE